MKNLLKILIVVFILLCAIAVQSQEPSPIPIKSSQKPQSQPKKIYNGPTDNQRGTDKSPIVVKVLPSDTAKEQSETETKNELDKSFYDKLISYSTVALAIVTAFLAFFTYRLWSATVRMSKDAKEAAARQAHEMQNSLAIAKESADAAQKSATVAEKTVSLHRAWVFAGIGGTNIVSPGVVCAHPDHSNNGVSPAFVEYVYIDTCLYSKPLPEKPIYKTKYTIMDPIQPGVCFKPIHHNETITMNIVEDTYVYGRIYYRDFFEEGTQRYSSFIYLIKMDRNGDHIRPLKDEVPSEYWKWT